eukprot:GHVO01045738.1.p1 GENE.GHVO01045738.1~~GHVO01045738.1.p1  ORF type:complete len:109 (-),score=12.01 GHVO01045738.1:185-511(-)
MSVYASLKHVFFICNVLHNVCWSHQFLRITVRNFKSKLIFHSHNHLDLIQAVKAKVVHEVAVEREFLKVNLVVEFQDEHDTLSDGVEGERVVAVMTDAKGGIVLDFRE